MDDQAVRHIHGDPVEMMRVATGLTQMCDDCIGALFGMVAAELDTRHAPGAAVVFLIGAIEEAQKELTQEKDTLN